MDTDPHMRCCGNLRSILYFVLRTCTLPNDAKQISIGRNKPDGVGKDLNDTLFSLSIR